VRLARQVSGSPQHENHLLLGHISPACPRPELSGQCPDSVIGIPAAHWPRVLPTFLIKFQTSPIFGGKKKKKKTKKTPFFPSWLMGACDCPNFRKLSAVISVGSGPSRQAAVVQSAYLPYTKVHGFGTGCHVAGGRRRWTDDSRHFQGGGKVTLPPEKITPSLGAPSARLGRFNDATTPTSAMAQIATALEGS